MTALRRRAAAVTRGRRRRISLPGFLRSRDLVGPVAGVLALGPVVGLAWWLLAPTGAVVAAQDYLLPVGTASVPAPSDVFAAGQDAVFAALAGAAGAAAGCAVALRPGRDRLVRWGSTMVAGLVAPVLAWSLGMLLGPASVAAQQAAGADPLASPLRLSSPAPLLVWSAATCIVAFVSALVSLLVRPPADGPAGVSPP